MIKKVQYRFQPKLFVTLSILFCQTYHRVKFGVRRSCFLGRNSVKVTILLLNWKKQWPWIVKTTQESEGLCCCQARHSWWDWKWIIGNNNNSNNQQWLELCLQELFSFSNAAIAFFPEKTKCLFISCFFHLFFYHFPLSFKSKQCWRFIITSPDDPSFSSSRNLYLRRNYLFEYSFPIDQWSSLFQQLQRNSQFRDIFNY